MALQKKEKKKKIKKIKKEKKKIKKPKKIKDIEKKELVILPKKGKLPVPKLSSAEAARVRQYVDTYYGIQKSRIETGNRINMLVRDYKLSDADAQFMHNKMDMQLFAVENEIKKALDKFGQQVAISAWLRSIVGIGPIITAGIISGMQSSGRFDNVAKLWSFCGYGLYDGQIQKRVRGKKINYSPFMKTLLWKAGESFVKVKGKDEAYYGHWYTRFREVEEEQHPEPVDVKSPSGKKYKNFTDGHKYARAKRKTIKLFLSHLWSVWRDIEGLPKREPYVKAKLGHNVDLPPNMEIVTAIKKKTWL